MTRDSRRALHCRRLLAVVTVLLAFGAIGLTGCATQTRNILSERPTDLPARVELADTPFFPDEAYHCGPAALATVLTAGGFPTQPDEVVGQVFVPDRKGSLQLEMLVAARRGGAVATVLPPELESVLRELAAGHPVVILQNLGIRIAPFWHYAVLVGYDLDASEVVLRSGPTKRQTMAMRTFEHTWARSRHWAFVALPPGQLAATAHEADATRALVAFERGANPDDAVIAYRAGLERWPDSLVIAIGLGNALYAAGDMKGAAEVFRAAATRHASSAAYNNLAVILNEQGHKQDALAAARLAVSLAAPDDAAPQQTLDRIEAQ